MTDVWDALRGGLVTRALALAAEHGVAHALADGPRSVDELAARRGADADVLYRLYARSQVRLSDRSARPTRLRTA